MVVLGGGAVSYERGTPAGGGAYILAVVDKGGLPFGLLGRGLRTTRWSTTLS